MFLRECRPSQTAQLLLSLRRNKPYVLVWVVLHCRVAVALRQRHGLSYLHWTHEPAQQQQTAVKLHGVFASLWKSLDFAPERWVHRVPVWDSGGIVTLLTGRQLIGKGLCSICYNFSFQKSEMLFLTSSLCLHKVRTVSSFLFSEMFCVQSLRVFLFQETFPADFPYLLDF